MTDLSVFLLNLVILWHMKVNDITSIFCYEVSEKVCYNAVKILSKGEHWSLAQVSKMQIGYRDGYS